MLTASNLATLSGLRHGFFSRKGGVSMDGPGDTDGLNCGFGSGDKPESVAENRRLALARLGLEKSPLVTAYQIHSATAVRVTKAWERADAPKADALVSAQSGVVLGILTADCAPVLFADSTARVIGAAHAGWRGARSGVLEACLDELVGLGANPSNIHAAIGPCIAQPSYEVGPEFHHDFVDEDVADGSFFIASGRAGHFLFDLPGYVERRLSKLGLASVSGLGNDTCADSERFYSYRRCTLKGEKGYGVQLSAIALDT